ncbi:CHST12 (predicted) [Pycnogonum litorale]
MINLLKTGFSVLLCSTCFVIIYMMGSRQTIFKNKTEITDDESMTILSKSQDKWTMRVQKVQKICESIRSQNKLKELHPSYGWRLIIGNKYKSLFCNVPKSASSTLKMDLLDAENMGINVTHNIQIHVKGEKLFTTQKIGDMLATTDDRLTNYFKFTFVRHPFTRIVSCYQDKAAGERGKYEYFFRLYWKKAMERYRNVANVPLGTNITFPEFVKYLIDSKDDDRHWMPIHQLCQPCSVEYDFIGKLETFTEDRQRLLEIFGINIAERRFNVQPRADSGDAYQKYFSMLDKEHVIALYRKYYYDFVFFNYSIQPFLSYVKI